MPTLDFIEDFNPLFIPTDPNYKTRHLVFYGGRGGMKSWQVARALLFRASQGCELILCSREFQNSIKDSVYAVLEQQAEMLGVHGHFDWQKTEIEHKATGSRFIFKGLARNIASIKSTEGITIAWVEEAENVSEDSWSKLLPTIRKGGSQIIVTFNTQFDTDPTFKRFVLQAANDPDFYVRKITYLDNPFKTQEMIDDAERMLRNDPDAYANVWLGECWTRSDAQVLNGKWRVDDFEVPDDLDRFYFGADWGFSVDPCTLIRCFVYNNVLYVDQEFYKVGLEVIDTADKFRTVPEASKNLIRADNARPEIISHLRNEGLNVVACKKWAGSVEDGISLLRGFDEIVIHPRCKYTIQEARLWSYKTDKGGDVLPTLIDKHNHCWDSVRYSLEPLIKTTPLPSIRVA